MTSSGDTLRIICVVLILSCTTTIAVCTVINLANVIAVSVGLILLELTQQRLSITVI
jgi:hypothetical protein